MGICSDVSRRHMLALSAAAGGLAVSGFDVASAQAGDKEDRADRPGARQYHLDIRAHQRAGQWLRRRPRSSRRAGMDQGRRLPAVQRHSQ